MKKILSDNVVMACMFSDASYLDEFVLLYSERLNSTSFNTKTTSQSSVAWQCSKLLLSLRLHACFCPVGSPSSDQLSESAGQPPLVFTFDFISSTQLHIFNSNHS